VFLKWQQNIPFVIAFWNALSIAHRDEKHIRKEDTNCDEQSGSCILVG
jgi:hypothetical protein